MSNDSATDAILTAQRVSKSFGAQPIFSDLTLALHEDERIGLIGRNGSGKSTLLKILAGREQPDAGVVTMRRGLRIGMLSQDCHIDRTITVGQAFDQSADAIQTLITEHDDLASRLSHEDESGLHARFEALHHQLQLANAWNLASEIKRLRQALTIAADETPISTLSGGELRRLDLALTLLQKPDVLLLDEPTNHIDTQSAEWIENYLKTYPGACILVTHDRYFLELVVTRIVEIEFNRLYSFPGNYERFLEYKLQIHDVQARTEQSRQGILRRELDWMRRGPKARATKQKARIQRYEDTEAQGPPQSHAKLAFQIPAPPRLGKRIVEADRIYFGYEGRELIRDFSMILQKTMRVGLLGPNGSGKTTLIELLMGRRDPKKGRVLIGDTTQFLYVDQSHAEFNPDQTIIDFVSNGAHYWEVNGNRIYVPAYLEGMLFDRATILMPMKNLSGGERNRMELARKLLQGGNVLVLDEPTNDLDLATLRVLEEAILAFDGPALIVSHDRYFLNRLCTHMIVFEDNHQLTLITGNYDDYLLYKEKTTEPSKLMSSRRKPGSPEPIPTPESTSKTLNRLTYKEKIELAAIEAAIQSAESEVNRLEQSLAAPNFYQQDHKLVQQTLTALQTAKSEVNRLYTRWHDLEQRQVIE